MSSTAAIIESLDWHIRDWNSGEAGSLIASVGQVHLAAGMDEMLGRRLAAAVDEAREKGRVDFDAELTAALEPLAFGSAMRAILVRIDAWADTVLAGSGPDARAHARTGFETFFASLDRPMEPCGPYGEPLLVPSDLEALLRRALLVRLADPVTTLSSS